MMAKEQEGTIALGQLEISWSWREFLIGFTVYRCIMELYLGPVCICYWRKL